MFFFSNSWHVARWMAMVYSPLACVWVFALIPDGCILIEKCFPWSTVVVTGCPRKIDHSAKFNFDARTQSNLPNDRFNDNCMLFPKPQCIDCGRWWRQLSVQCHSSCRCDARIPVLWLGLLARNTVARRPIYWGMVGRIIASTVQRSNEWCNLITSTYLKNDDDYSLSH